MADIRICLVAVASRNGVINTDGRPPWSVPSELRRFKALTEGHPIILGRNAYLAIGRPLADRDNIVVTRGEIVDDPRVHTVNSVEEAIALATRFAVNRKVDEIMVIGGWQIYEQTLPLADRVYFTRVEMDVEGDTLFPNLNPERWREVDRQEHKAGPKDNADFTTLIYDRAA